MLSLGFCLIAVPDEAWRADLERRKKQTLPVPPESPVLSPYQSCNAAVTTLGARPSSLRRG